MDTATKAKNLYTTAKKSANQSSLSDWSTFPSKEFQVLFGSLANDKLGLLGPSQIDFLSATAATQFRDRLRIFERLPISFLGSLDQMPYEPSFLGREQELSSACHALTRLSSVEIYGSDGIGKTRFLRQLLANHITKLSNIFSGGIAFPTVFHESDVEDIAQTIFHCFFGSNFFCKPSLGDIAQYFRQKRFLVIYDQSRRFLSQSEVNQLKKILPSCSFFYISLEPCAFIDVVSIHLKGLSINDSMRLGQEFLEPTLSNLEQQSLQELCHLLQGNPNLIIQNLAPVRDRSTTLLQVCHRVRLAKSNSAYTVRPFASTNPGLREGIISTMAVFKHYGLKGSQMKSILQMPDLGTALVALLQSSYLSYVAVSPDSIDSSKTGSWEASFSLTSNIDQALESEGFLFDIRSSLIYFLSLNWGEIVTSYDFSASDIAPLVMLFRQSVRQSNAYSIIALGNVLSLACLRLGLWGMRKKILLIMLDWTFELSSKITTLLSLGLQELCMSNYEESSEYLTQARSLCNGSGERYFLSTIELYLDLVTQLKNSCKSYGTVIASAEQEQDVPISYSGKSFASSDRATDKSDRKAKKPMQRPLIRYGLLALSVGLISYTLFGFLLSKWNGLAGSQFYKFTAIERLNGLTGLDKLAGDYTSIFFSNVSIITDHKALFSAQNSSQPRSESLLATQKNGKSSINGFSALVDLLPKDAPRYSAQNGVSLPATTSPSANLEEEVEGDTTNVNDVGYDANPVEVSYVPESTLSSSIGRNIGNREREVSVSDASLARYPEPSLSKSMCRFLVSELAMAEQTSNQNPDMYRLLLDEGNCIR
jgi:hypothetical protein